MKIVFPLYYGMTGRLPGKKHAHTYAYRELIEVNIREVSAEEAPIACMWKPNPEVIYNADNYLTNHGKSGPGGLQFTRWHENRHWKRMIMADGFLMHAVTMNDLELDRVQFQAMLRGGNIQHAVGVECFAQWVTAAKDVADDPASQFDVVKYSHRAEVLSSMEKMLDNVIAVDGIIHAVCFEPFIAVRKANRPGTDVREMVVETTDRPLTITRDTVADALRIDRFDDALAIATESGTDGVEQLLGVRPEILIPEAFTFDWEMYWGVTRRMNLLWKELYDAGVANNAPLGIAARTADPEERFAGLSSISDEAIAEWDSLGFSMQPLYEALDILNDRPVHLDMPTLAAMRIRMK
jgi:hypothetical protein